MRQEFQKIKDLTNYDKELLKNTECMISHLEGNHGSSKDGRFKEAEAAIKEKSTTGEKRQAAVEFVRAYHGFENAKK